MLPFDDPIEPEAQSVERFAMKLSTSLLVASIPFLIAPAGAEAPLSSNPYFADGQNTLSARRALKPNKKPAKNVILFVGDGMDPTTIAAARIFDGQSRGEEGEENFLSFEKFPYLAMSKTYNTNAQTPDSAGTMSAARVSIVAYLVIGSTRATMSASCWP